MESPSQESSEATKNETTPRDTATPSPLPVLNKSSSSSSLLIPENKRDSPTKSNRLRKSVSSGSLRDTATPSPLPLLKSSSSSSLLLPVPENKKDSPTKARRSVSSGSLARKSPSAGSRSSTPIAAATPEAAVAAQDAATILESLEIAEKKQLVKQQQTSSPPSLVVKKTTPTKIQPSRKDGPSGGAEKRATPRRASPTISEQVATMERLERICASPISVDSRDTADTNAESTTKSSPRAPARIKSLQWHQHGPQAAATTSRVITPQEVVQPSATLLPSPPSMRISSSSSRKEEVVAVFNANTQEGKSMVRALAKSGSHVVAIVRVFTSKNTKSLLKLGDNVVVKVADSHDGAALSKAVEGADRAFLVTTYWDRFDGALEETQALLVLEACASQNVHHLVLSSFEDTKILREKGLKSQIVPRADGTITPNFDGMKSLKDAAKAKNVQLTHMVTSYLDQEHSKKSLCLIVGENGNLIVNSHIPEED